VTRTRLVRAVRPATEPLVVCLLALPATVPLWQSKLPRSFDGMFHLFRLLEIDSLARQLLLFPRWAPDLLYGYGYPIFDFVPHLPYYLTDVAHVVGLTLVHSTLLSFVLSLLASGVAMYFFVKEIFGSNAGILAAVAYVYGPFHLYDILFRGHLPGAWAIVLYPLILWSVTRLARKSGVSSFVATSLLFAACLLTHNPAAYIFTPFLLFYALVLVLTAPDDRKRRILRVAASILLGAGLASFFWIPALWDRQFIQIDRMITPPDLDYHTHFITTSNLLSPPPVAEVGLMNPDVPNSLGPALVAVAMLSIVGLWRLRRRDERTHLIVALIGLAVVIFLVSAQSTFVWESVPLMKHLVFPHRFLRLGSLLVAFLCGAAVRVFGERAKAFSPSFLATLGLSGVVVLSAFPLLYPPYYDHQSLNPSFADMMEFERSTGTLGTTSFGEYLPVWVTWIPSTSPLESLYQSSAQIERLDQSSLPDGTHVTSAHYEPTSMTVALDAPQEFQATFHLLYFPTWRADVDGQEVPVTPTEGQGLVSVSVPAGEHVIHIQLHDMPIHTLSKLLSGASLVLFLALSAVGWVRRRVPSPGATVAQLGSTYRAVEEPPRDARTMRATVLSTMAVLLLVLKVGYIDTHDTFFKRAFDGLTVKAAQKPLEVNLADQVTLMGYDLSASTLQPGDTLNVVLYWKARQRLVSDFSVFAQLVDEEKNIYAQKDSLNPGGYPTHLWELDEYNRDQHEICIPLGTPPGKYSLGVGLYDPDTMMRLSILEDEGHEAGMYFLEQVTVTRPESPPAIEDLDMQRQVAVEYENGMTLLGYSAERDYLPAGDFYRLALFWMADARLPEDYSVSIRLLDSEGDVALSRTSEPSAGRYPTTAWEEGEIVRDNHAIRVPKDLPQGQYRLQLAVFDADGRAVHGEVAPDVDMAGSWVELLILDSVR
jgi:hypothetical protein